MRRWQILGLAVLLAFSENASNLNAQAARSSDALIIDATAPRHPLPHFWEKMFGSGRAILSLRESYRSDLKSVKQITDFSYIRFHAIFHDEVGVYSEDDQGRPVYNFSYVDQIYDGLLANGVRPELIVILSDINMPGMDGLSLLREIKTRRPDLPVMMVTAYGDDERRRQAAEAGALQFLTKPVDFDLLKEELRRLSGAST